MGETEEAAEWMFERTDNEHLLSGHKSTSKVVCSLEIARLDRIQAYLNRVINKKQTQMKDRCD